MSIVTRLASPPEYRKLAPWFTDAGQAAPTLADMVLLAEDGDQLCGGLRVVMARGVIRLDSVVARDNTVLAILLQQLSRWIGREACWGLVPKEILPTYIAAGFVEQAVVPDTLKDELQDRDLIAVMRPVMQEGGDTAQIAQAASTSAGISSV